MALTSIFTIKDRSDRKRHEHCIRFATREEGGKKVPKRITPAVDVQGGKRKIKEIRQKPGTRPLIQRRGKVRRCKTRYGLCGGKSRRARPEANIGIPRVRIQQYEKNRAKRGLHIGGQYSEGLM